MLTFTFCIDFSTKFNENYYDNLLDRPDFIKLIHTLGQSTILDAIKSNDNFILAQFTNEIQKFIKSKSNILLSLSMISVSDLNLFIKIVKKNTELKDYVFQAIINLGRQDLVVEKIARIKNPSHPQFALNLNESIEVLASTHRVIELCKQECGMENLHILIDKNIGFDNVIIENHEFAKFFPRTTESNYSYFFGASFKSREGRFLGSLFDGFMLRWSPYSREEIISTIEEIENTGVWQSSYEISFEAREEILTKSNLANQIISKMYFNSEELFDKSMEESASYPEFTNLRTKDLTLFVNKLKEETKQAVLLFFDNDPNIIRENDKELVKMLKTSTSIEFCKDYDEEYTLTVLSTTYNHENYLEECINSVQMQQTDFKVKHIVLDNYSTDGTSSLLYALAKKYKNVYPVFIYDPFIKLPLYQFINLAKTKYVATCDGDDYFSDPLKLQKQVDFLEKNPSCAVCFHSTEVKFEDFPQRNYIFPRYEHLPRGVQKFYYLTDLIRGNLMQSSSPVYRWRFKDGIPDWFMGDLIPFDWYLHILHAEVGKIGFINEPMSVYRRHRNAYFVQSIYNGMQAQDIIHGMKTLEFYDAVNMHFDRKFEKDLAKMSMSIFNNFSKYGDENNDSSYFEEATKKYGYLAKVFMDQLPKDYISPR